MIRLTIISCLLCCVSIANSQTVKSARYAIKQLIEDDELKNASIGFYAVDLDSNQIISGIHSSQSLVPASTMKLITTATALEMMGEGKRFVTTIQYSGDIDTVNKVLNGNVYIIGGGDPCLGSSRYIKHYGDFISKWATAIIDLGVDSINGRIIADATIFNEQMIPATWIWGDLGNYYGAGPCGLSIYENLCRLSFESGKKGDSTYVSCVNPYVPGLTFDNDVKSMAIKRDQSYIYGAPYQTNRFIKGGIPTNRKGYEVKGSIPDPAYLTAFELDMELRGQGIGLSNTATTIRRMKVRQREVFEGEKQTVIITKSPKLSSIIESTNLYSINLYAEHLMNQIGALKYKSGDTGSGTTATQEFWKENKLDMDGFYINDGSGLSRFNAITAKQMVGVLKHMYQSKNYEMFLNSLPVAGKSGTLRNVGKGTAASGKVKAKSGYMTRVRSYAGYVTTKNKRNIAFALIVNNYNCTAYEMKKKMEKVMVKLAEIND